MTVGVTAADDGAWIPDPANPRRYSTRDLPAEHAAFMCDFAGRFRRPQCSGHWQLLGQERVLAFFSREYPRMEREWSVTLEERLERNTDKSRTDHPSIQDHPRGQQWFDLEVTYSGTGGNASVPRIFSNSCRRRGAGSKTESSPFWTAVPSRNSRKSCSTAPRSNVRAMMESGIEWARVRRVSSSLRCVSRDSPSRHRHHGAAKPGT